MSLILASASPRRKELLSLITEDFAVIPAKGEEILDKALPPEKQVMALARQKSEEVSALYPDSVVVGADTMVFVGEAALGKPKDSEDAARMLKLLSGKLHAVITAVSISKGGRSQTVFAEKTEVEFYPLTEREITDYINSGEPMDKAGAYGIQGRGALLIKGIKGDYYNVMGLPAARLYRELKAFSDHSDQRSKE
ncbi:MAG: Maf family protein [Firmicutes bacterium]|nr:Maf family protein [[Eubacterium] siraeum]MCM1489020.1 Maf family protein [Bacillota bacterium]